MKPGFDFDRSDGAWHRGMDFWHHGFADSFPIPAWGAAVGAAAAVALYFVPALIAVVRRHPNRLAILLLNLLLGWTFFGWAVALVWAVTATRRPSGPPPWRPGGHRDPYEPET